MKALVLAALGAAAFAAPSSAARLEVGVAFYGGTLFSTSTDDDYVPGTVFGGQYSSGAGTDTYRRAGAASVATYGTLGVAASTRSVLDHRGGNFNDYAAGFARLGEMFTAQSASATTTLALRFVVDIAATHTAHYYPGEDWEVTHTGISKTDVTNGENYDAQTYAVLGLFMNSGTALACYQAPASYNGFSSQCQNSLLHVGHNDFTINLTVNSNQPVGLLFTLLADTRQFRPANDQQGAFSSGTIDAGIFALGTAHIYASTPDPMTSFTTESGFSYLAPSAVPEPAAWALLIGGFGLAGAAGRRKAAIARTA